MAKARRKAARRRRRGGIRMLEAAREVIHQPPAEPQRDPREVVAEARRRTLGLDDVLRPMLCEPAGQAVALGASDADEARELYAVFCRFDRADETYMRRIIGRARFQAVSKLEILPEQFETRADDVIDPRSADEKDRDAVNTWMRWQGLLGRLSAREHTLIVGVSRHTAGPVHRDGALTPLGADFIAAMRALRSAEGGG